MATCPTANGSSWNLGVPIPLGCPRRGLHPSLCPPKSSCRQPALCFLCSWGPQTGSQPCSHPADPTTPGPTSLFPVKLRDTGQWISSPWSIQGKFLPKKDNLVEREILHRAGVTGPFCWQLSGSYDHTAHTLAPQHKPPTDRALPCRLELRVLGLRSDGKEKSAFQSETKATA